MSNLGKLYLPNELGELCFLFHISSHHNVENNREKFQENLTTTSIIKESSKVVWDKPHEYIKSGCSNLSYLPNKLATLIALPALAKVILVLKRYLSSCLKEGRRPVAVCAP